MSVTIQLRRDTAANWASVNPVPFQGELCEETDTLRMKVGDGVTAWNSLAYLGLAGGVLTAAISPAVVTLVDASVVAINSGLGNAFSLLATSAVGASRQLGTPSNPSPEQLITIDFTQAASGGPYTLTYTSAYDFGDAGTPTTSTSVLGDTLAFRYRASSGKWRFQGIVTGFAP